MIKRIVEAYLKRKKSPIHLDNEMMWVPLSKNKDEGGAHQMPDGSRWLHIASTSIVATSPKAVDEGINEEKTTSQEAD